MSSSATKRAEIAYLDARCRLVLDAIAASDPDASALVGQMRAALETTVAAGNVRGLRIIRRDLFDMRQVLPPMARAALDAHLEAQAAEDPFPGAAG